MDIAIWVQAIAACVLVIATAVLVITNIGLAKATKKYADISEKIADYTKQYVEESKNYVTATHAMVDEMKKDGEERIKPSVTMGVHKKGQAYMLRLANLGGSPAYDIDLVSNRDEIKSSRIPKIYQNDEILLPLGNEEYWGIRKIQYIRVGIKYKDRLNNSYSDELQLNLALAHSI